MIAKCESKSGLLVAPTTVKDIDKFWSILIDIRPSGNYVKCRSMEASQQFAEALKAHEGDVYTVHWATGVRVTVHQSSCELRSTILKL